MDNSQPDEILGRYQDIVNAAFGACRRAVRVLFRNEIKSALLITIDADGHASTNIKVESTLGQIEQFMQPYIDEHTATRYRCMVYDIARRHIYALSMTSVDPAQPLF